MDDTLCIVRTSWLMRYIVYRPIPLRRLSSDSQITTKFCHLCNLKPPSPIYYFPPIEYTRNQAIQYIDILHPPTDILHPYILHIFLIHAVHEYSWWLTTKGEGKLGFRSSNLGVEWGNLSYSKSTWPMLRILWKKLTRISSMSIGLLFIGDILSTS